MAEEDKGAGAKHQTNEFYELLHARNPKLIYTAMPMDDLIYKEMVVFGLIPPPTKGQVNKIVPLKSFVYKYQTDLEVVLDDPKMIRYVYYNIIFTCLRSSRLPIDYDGELQHIQDTDIYPSLFKTLPSKVTDLDHAQHAGDLSMHGIWNIECHNKTQFRKCVGSGVYSYFLHPSMSFHDIPKEAIIYITREVTLIDIDTMKGTNKILQLLQCHETLIQENLQQQVKLKSELKRLKDQEEYFTNVYPNLADIKLQWQDKQKENVKRIIQEKRQQLEVERQKAILSYNQQREEIIIKQEERKALAMKMLQDEHEKTLTKLMLPLKKEIHDLELQLMDDEESFSIPSNV